MGEIASFSIGIAGARFTTGDPRSAASFPQSVPGLDGVPPGPAQNLSARKKARQARHRESISARAGQGPGIAKPGRRMSRLALALMTAALLPNPAWAAEGLLARCKDGERLI